MGMADYVIESFNNLLAGDSQMISDFGSSGGSHETILIFLEGKIHRYDL
jgi:hypothetical protein